MGDTVSYWSPTTGVSQTLTRDYAVRARETLDTEQIVATDHSGLSECLLQVLERDAWTQM